MKALILEISHLLFDSASRGSILLVSLATDLTVWNVLLSSGVDLTFEEVLFKGFREISLTLCSFKESGLVADDSLSLPNTGLTEILLEAFSETGALSLLDSNSDACAGNLTWFLTGVPMSSSISCSLIRRENYV